MLRDVIPHDALAACQRTFRRFVATLGRTDNRLRAREGTHNVG